MKENKYDDPKFFDQYSQMNRSVYGLEAAGEWHTLRTMLPELAGKTILDLGCGFGWHCRYAIEQGAKIVKGIDISRKMLERAAAINQLEGIEYIQKPIEEVTWPDNSFDIVLSSLAFHYLASFDAICNSVYDWLRPGGCLVFSVEHPVFTASPKQDWIYSEKGEIQHWPVDQYFMEGRREVVFLGEKIAKYHRTLSTYLNALLKQGFIIKEVNEPTPEEKLLDTVAGMKDELRRPMMLLIRAEK
ncbi:class I SAM-dependent methyltransferase [Pseudoflavitalea sp. G-6-1-2]|uniref:class I SAM-dependent methyltransferase n=1 Tax=Pseudoflavitalea sp. G-6-1-2 TaxID=2728841 RepID=UPI00146D9E6D|nr:class I SAM-dependent methyltransferase [Pseudoflavitalea sp. G-6-1-2]NML22016.1 class I SAM-dependent methyltransferase [Pseudoflavitalea sp. G-6-1-2]